MKTRTLYLNTENNWSIWSTLIIAYSIVNKQINRCSHAFAQKITQLKKNVLQNLWNFLVPTLKWIIYSNKNTKFGFPKMRGWNLKIF